MYKGCIYKYEYHGIINHCAKSVIHSGHPLFYIFRKKMWGRRSPGANDPDLTQINVQINATSPGHDLIMRAMDRGNPFRRSCLWNREVPEPVEASRAQIIITRAIPTVLLAANVCRWNSLVFFRLHCRLRSLADSIKHHLVSVSCFQRTRERTCLDNQLWYWHDVEADYLQKSAREISYAPCKVRNDGLEARTLGRFQENVYAEYDSYKLQIVAHLTMLWRERCACKRPRPLALWIARSTMCTVREIAWHGLHTWGQNFKYETLKMPTSMEVAGVVFSRIARIFLSSDRQYYQWPETVSCWCVRGEKRTDSMTRNHEFKSFASVSWAFVCHGTRRTQPISIDDADVISRRIATKLST